jgi:5-methylcytosine-specific restriction endonuclease McrA
MERDHRKQIAETEPMCRKCGRPANDVDHIRNRKSGGSWNPEILSIENKQPLCRECHIAKKGKSESTTTVKEGG